MTGAATTPPGCGTVPCRANGAPRSARFTAAALAWAALASSTAWAACGDALPATGRQQPAATAAPPGDRAATLVWVSAPTPLPLDRQFSLQVAVCQAGGEPLAGRLQVDADMPAHRHGMNYQPTVQALDAGLFQVDGLLLHMAGQWRLRFTLTPAPGATPLRWQQLLDL